MKKNRLLTVAALAAGFALTACSSSAAPSGESPSDADSPATDALPAALQGDLENPVLIYPPLGFKNEDGTYGGWTVEIAHAIADDLGVSVTDREDTFENMLTGIEGGKYPWLVAADITAERLEVYDFAYLYDDFASFVSTIDGPELTDDLLSTCGYTISALTSSVQATRLDELSADCVAAGEDPIEIKQYKDLASQLLGIRSGQDDFLAVYVSTEITDDDTLKVTGPTINNNKIGIITKKGSGVAEAVADAVNALIADGTYQEILGAQYSDDHLIEESTVNPTPTSGK